MDTGNHRGSFLCKTDILVALDSREVSKCINTGNEETKAAKGPGKEGDRRDCQRQICTALREKC